MWCPLPTVRIPNNWVPRPYQLGALQAFERGQRRQSHVWHRRAGKDSFSLNLASIQAHREVGTYWHLFPLQTQARKAIWSGIGADGKRFIEQAFPMPIRAATRQQEMQIELKCGSIWQMAGSDQYDALVGSNVKGVIFSEWALCDPAAWDYIRPIIRENDGWVVFITTYRGKNHAWRMHQRALKDPAWYATTMTVNDTQRGDGQPVLTADDIEAERREGMAEAMIQQEYYCSPLAAFEGAYYQHEMLKLHESGRILPVLYEPTLPVLASFDLGMDDHTAVIFIQECGNEIRLLGSRSYRFTSIPDIVADLRKLPYPIAEAIMPHDVKVKELGTGQSRYEVFRSQGLQCRIAPMLRVQEGIEAVRNKLARVYIHEEASELIDALSGYRTEEKKSAGVFNLSPLHSWESHLADSFRYYCTHKRVKISDSSAPIDYSNFSRAG